MKQTMSSFDVGAITFELAKMLKGSRIDNIYHIIPSTVILSLHPKNDLIIEAGKRIHLTKYQIKKPSAPSSFCMFLRKHLKNSIIEDVRQPSFERILFLTLSTKNGALTLAAEFFGKGNIILLGEDRRITCALSYRRMRDRNIIRGEPFMLPPPRGTNPLETTLQELLKIQKENLSCVEALSQNINVGSQYIREILSLAEIKDTKKCAELGEEDLAKILHSLKSLTSKLVHGEYSPCIIFDPKGEAVDALPFPLSMYSEYEKKFYGSFNETLDEYFTKQTTEFQHVQKRNVVASKIKDYERILAQQEEQKTSLEKTILDDQKIGALIYAHLNDLQELLRLIRSKRDLGETWDNIISEFSEQKKKNAYPASIVESIEPAKGVLKIKINGDFAELNLSISIQDNATMYYEKAKRAKKKLNGLLPATEKTKTFVGTLESELLVVEEEKKEPEEKPKREWFEKFRWTYSSEGFLIIGGRDATTNEIIFKKYMEPNDLVMHADFVGAPLVLIKTADKAPSQTTLNEAAELAASYSRAWRMGLGAIDVFWFRPDQISKTPPSGEHLPKGSFVINGKKNYIKNVQLRISVGLKEVDEKPVIIAGPSSSVFAQTKIFVEIVPGNMSSEKLAKQIKQRLSEMVPQQMRPLVFNMSPEDFQRFIPSGGGKLLKDRT